MSQDETFHTASHPFIVATGLGIKDIRGGGGRRRCRRRSASVCGLFGSRGRRPASSGAGRNSTSNRRCCYSTGRCQIVFIFHENIRDGTARFFTATDTVAAGIVPRKVWCGSSGSGIGSGS